MATTDQMNQTIPAHVSAWIERAKQYLGAAYDNDCLHFSEGPEFLKGPHAPNASTPIST